MPVAPPPDAAAIAATGAEVRRAAARFHVTGLVQGVGFRPFVHRLAVRHDLAGWVLNASGAVEIHVEGASVAIDAFEVALGADAPVLARIERADRAEAVPAGLEAFRVRTSEAKPGGRLPVSPDVATCEACAREMLDPHDRRYRYPFITCTDCGPRFTVIEAMPYDRERTSMRAFEQCPECRAEYTTPGDRRYHSETNSCPECGPRLWLEHADGAVIDGSREGALAAAAEILRGGGIVAVRGLGGFHLAVDATDDAAVRRLRERKHREAKPLAVMVRSASEVRELARVSAAELGLLASPMRPVVLVERRDSAGTGDASQARALAASRAPQTRALAASVAPGLDRIGVMLAYTPLHHLLLDAVARPLVMTSGNLSDEPIAIDNDEARVRLTGIADAWLLHDRDIVARYDDSVLRVVGGAPLFLRRARGYAPMPIDIPVASPRPLLAMGPHLKNTFTLLHEARAFVSQHIGDLDNLETVEHFRAALDRFEALFRIRPEVVIHDLHPGYLSTRLAGETGLDVLPAAQHHHAHVAAVMAEHGRTAPVIGVAYDGTGYGTDGAVWGAEVLYADLADFRRLAHLRYAPLPGGDAAARAPWRVALGYAASDGGGAPAFGREAAGIPERTVALVRQQLAQAINTPPASSMGRLFDAAAAVLGVRQESRYEGQAAMELESLAGQREAAVLPWDVTVDADGCDVLDPLPLLRALGDAVRGGGDVPALAAAFHETVVAATTDLVERAGARTGCRVVALGGGCFQNARLLSGVHATLTARGFEVLVPRQLGPNDGAVSLGQAAIGAARLAGPGHDLLAPVTALSSFAGR